MIQQETKASNYPDLQVYNYIYQNMVKFFTKRNFLWVNTQHIPQILAACENPFSISTYTSADIEYPLPQTSQMHLENILLENPQYDGVFCFTTSYRDEKDPIKDRHSLIFPMVEWETKGNLDDLYNLEHDLLEYFDFHDANNCYDRRKYLDVCKLFGCKEIGHEEETKIWENIAPILFLTDFPEYTSPFWNMKRNSDDTANKIDVILYGIETIGSAERECNPDIMRDRFYSIMDGKYYQKLFELFGKERVEQELEEFLSHDFFPRVGAGMGLGRFARALKLLHKDDVIL
jgi:aspartyl/asparaginyl-tRNA synthetase